jgi:inhibitor of the pro-sigma K processing machinery
MMVGVVEIIALLVGIVLLYLLFTVTKSLISLLINSIVAIILLFAVNFFGLGIAINIWSVLIVAIAGLPGLLLVIVLHLLKIAF